MTPGTIYITPPSSHQPSTGGRDRARSPSSKLYKQRSRAVATLVISLTIIGLVWGQRSFIFTSVNNFTTTPSLFDHIDIDTSKELLEIAETTQYTKCKSTAFKGAGMSEFAPHKKVFPRLNTLTAIDGAIQGNSFVELLIKDAPCWGVHGCCETNTYLRPKDKNDHKSFTSIFQDHSLRLLYSLFANSTPQYILEAGAGPGFASQLFKLIWPRAVLVAVESDPGNFENLMLNTRETDGVHAVHAGLWPYHAMLRQVKKKGFLVLEETKDLSSSSSSSSDGEAREEKPTDNIIGVSVNTLANMFDIPAFDFVYLDIEGAEAAVFSRAADLSWLSTAKVVAIRLHDKLGKYFGLDGKNLVNQMSSGSSRRFFHVLQDEDCLFLVSPSVLDSLQSDVLPRASTEEGRDTVSGNKDSYEDS